MFSFHWYGFFIGLGIVAALEVSEMAKKLLAIRDKPARPFRSEASRRGRLYARFSVWKIFWWVMIPALLGARLYHVIDFWTYYSRFPGKAVALWEGGMGIWGGIIGGLVGLWIYSLIVGDRGLNKKFSIFNFQFSKRISNFLALADLAVVGLPLGQAIGRIGNFFNQELYGLPSNLPWGLYIRPENRLAGYESFTHFHPLFAYEMIWDLLIFIIIIKIILKADRTTFKIGNLFFIYLFLYGLGRFFLESLRIDPWRWGSLTVAQWLSLVAITLASLYITKVWKINKHS